MSRIVRFCGAELEIIEASARAGRTLSAIRAELQALGFTRSVSSIYGTKAYAAGILSHSQPRPKASKAVSSDYVEFDGMRIYKQTYPVPTLDWRGDVTGYANVSLARVSL